MWLTQSESPALLACRGFTYHASTLTTHCSHVCYVLLCFLPRELLSKRETARSLRESNKYTAVFSFLPDVHAQFTRYTRKPQELLARFEETHFGGRSFMSLTYLLTWPFLIHSQSQSRICWSKICLTVTPEWAVHSRPRYQDSVQVNTIFFCLIVMSCNWEKPIFKDILAVYRWNTDTALCRSC